MATEDAYGNRARFERRLQEMPSWAEPPEGYPGRGRRRYRRKYQVVNPKNLPLFPRIAEVMAARDLSYVRRNRYLDVLLFMLSNTDKELGDCTQQDVDRIIAAGHRANLTRASKATFLAMMDVVLKTLVPGRFTVEKRVERAVEREVDRVTFDEVRLIVRYLRDDHLFRAYVTTILETYIRPQELVWRTMKDVTVVRKHGIPRYAKVSVSSHGKKGIKNVVIKDTLGYFMEWLQRHPHAEDPDAYLFPSMQDLRSLLKPTNATNKLKKIRRRLGIKGRLGSYELKSRGITFACLRYDPPKLIQARARWANLDPLPTYDKSTSDQVLEADLARDGLLDEVSLVEPFIRPKDCPCGAVVGFAELDCPSCGREMTGDMIRRPGSEPQTAMPASRVLGAEAKPSQELLAAIAEVLQDPSARDQLKDLLAGTEDLTLHLTGGSQVGEA